MAGRPEQKLAVLRTERLVLHIHGDSISCLILERERNIVLNAIFLLVSSLHLFQCSLEKWLELRRNSENHIGGAIGIAHVILSLHQMLGKCSPALPVRVSMKTDHALRLRTIVQSLVSQHFLSHIFSISSRVGRFSEHRLRIESEIPDLRRQFTYRRISTGVIALI